jgi:chemotaxis protein methyltransferase CheR
MSKDREDSFYSRYFIFWAILWGRIRIFLIKSYRKIASEMMRINPRNKADQEALVKFRTLIPELAFYDERSAERQLRINALINGYKTLERYYDSIASHAEKQGVLRENLTYLGTTFFRGKAWPEFKNVCQDLIASSGDEKLRIWCAGCSSGKEAYSVLMVLLDYIPANKIELLATDYNHAMLERCEEAIYPLSTIEDIPSEYWRHLEKHIPGKFRVREESREIVRTGVLDLLEDDYPQGFDIILCRNVMKFFEPGAKSLVQRKLAEALNSGGILFVSDELEKEGIPDPEKMGLCQFGSNPLYLKK